MNDFLKVKHCIRCDLCLTVNHIVSGEGSYNADMMFILEAPGYKEDKENRLLVGKSGKLIDYYLNLYGWNRQDIYITNVIKCKTLRNRVPNAIEISNCKEYLMKELRTVKPKILVLFGNTAMSEVAGISNSVKKSAGHPFRHDNGMIVVPMFHPSYIAINSEMIYQYEEHWKLLYIIFRRMIPEYQFNPKYQ